jgi:hypothetical protein
MRFQKVYLFVLVDHLFVYRLEFQSPLEEDLVEKWVLVLGYRLQIDSSIFDASLFRNLYTKQEILGRLYRVRYCFCCSSYRIESSLHHLAESSSLQSLSTRGRLLLHNISRYDSFCCTPYVLS